MKSLLFIGLLGITLQLGVGSGAAQSSSCADCHFANPETEPAGRHLDDWDRSAHGRNGVGCEECHGGDPSTFEPFLAHRGILNSRNPASPTNETNLPVTCGRCHPSHLAVFRETKHYELIRGGDRSAPNCSTCHGEVAANLLSPKGLEQKCEGCHGPEKSVPLPEVSAQARILLREIGEVGDILRQVERLISRVKDDETRSRLTSALIEARILLRDAAHVGHTFDFVGIEEKVELARAAADGLLEMVANPR